MNKFILHSEYKPTGDQPEAIEQLEAVERFGERTGHYPERLLADQIDRTRDNRNLTKQSSKEKKQEYQDNTDRIEVERSFSLSKRCYGMDLIRTRTGNGLISRH